MSKKFKCIEDAIEYAIENERPIVETDGMKFPVKGYKRGRYMVLVSADAPKPPKDTISISMTPSVVAAVRCAKDVLLEDTFRNPESYPLELRLAVPPTLKALENDDWNIPIEQYDEVYTLVKTCNKISPSFQATPEEWQLFKTIAMTQGYDKVNWEGTVVSLETFTIGEDITVQKNGLDDTLYIAEV